MYFVYVDIKPENISIHSKRLLWWRCPESTFVFSKVNHKWRCTAQDMINVYHQECPFCGQLLFSDEDVNELWVEPESHDHDSHSQTIKHRKKNPKEKEGRIRRCSLQNLDSFLQNL